MKLNSVELAGVVQDKSAKGNTVWRYFEANDSKQSMISFSLAVPNGTDRTSYIRCIARGITADAINKQVGNEVQIVGTLTNVKIKDNWVTQVSVDDVDPFEDDGHDQQETRTKESVADLRDKQAEQ